MEKIQDEEARLWIIIVLAKDAWKYIFEHLRSFSIGLAVQK